MLHDCLLIVDNLNVRLIFYRRDYIESCNSSGHRTNVFKQKPHASPMPRKIDKKMLLAAWSINNPNWIINQAYNIPLRNIFREVINFDPQEETYKYGKKVMNQKFLEVLKKNAQITYICF